MSSVLFRYYPGKTLDPANYPYKVITAPATTPITLADIKTQCRIDWSTIDTWITNFILSPVISYAENYTRLNFITRKYQTTRDYFESFIELRKAPNGALTSFKYYNQQNILTAVDPSCYYTVEKNYYTLILPTPDTGFPANDLTIREAGIIIEFTAGFGTLVTDVPADLKAAMLQHACHLYQNRGDWMETVATSERGQYPLPAMAKAIYDEYRIKDISGVSFYG
jgi:uncharacterized phiE125 gp8 family phage protein